MRLLRVLTLLRLFEMGWIRGNMREGMLFMKFIAFLYFRFILKHVVCIIILYINWFKLLSQFLHNQAIPITMSKKCSSCEGTDHQRPNSRKCPNFGTKATKSKPEAKVKQESEETKPKICSSCGFYGHKTSKSQHCPKNVLSVDFDEVPLLGNPLFESFVDYSVEQTKIQQKWDANEPEPWSDKDYDMVGVRYEAWCSLSDGKKSVFKGRI
ncbi:hypothetical protein BCR33DRAFT_532899 [Rhizoclosmatium globosum]|uniref:Zinc knuckle domain-containing protein n=1 Tax=Rhizoclosmatium globosum TaxID=329046 RepID=A0A1Y2BDB9_9FUNG|nr:hypothetical protein BCR33DRAFT_532899 [Rhizoclosmatium globosum]|eukprot:ORY32706.1 hypothetical protein BCR33DRAFT_532899 [Rhizoclosmatium globosum]